MGELWLAGRSLGIKFFGALLLWLPALTLDLRRIVARQTGKVAAGAAAIAGAGLGVYVPNGTLSLDDFQWALLWQGLASLTGFSPAGGFNPARLTDWALRTGLFGIGGYAFAQWLQINRDVDARRPTRIRAAWTDLSRTIAFRDKMPSLVLGIGGVGKTTLLEYLSHNFLISRISLGAGNRWSADGAGFESVIRQVYDKQVSLGGAIRAYNITGAKEQYPVAHERRMWDVPGQGWQYGEWDGLIESATKSGRMLIVNMSTYGYSAALRTALNLSEYGNTPREIAENYAPRRRAEEVEAVSRIIDRVLEAESKAPGRLRLTFVNVVNMAGFWWGPTGEGRDARAFYLEDAGVSKEWDRLKKALGRRVLLEPFAPASLLFDDMPSEKDRTGESGCFRQIFCADPEYKDLLMGQTGALLQLLLEELYRSDWRARTGLLNARRRDAAGLPAHNWSESR